MIEKLFLILLNMSISASWLIAAVLFLRPLLRKAPKWSNCLLWGFVAFRLICPYSLESTFSLVPTSEPIPMQSMSPKTLPVITASTERSLDFQLQRGIPSMDQTPTCSEGVRKTAQTLLFSNIHFFAGVWLIGMTALLFYALASFLRLRKKVGASLCLYDNIFICDEIPSPFILGIVKPKIYLPSSMADKHLIPVTAHERAHLSRRDHLWKPFGYLLLTVYWFNPLIWAAYFFFCQDIEFACDESALRRMDPKAVAAYSQAMLDFNFPRRTVRACPLAFGEISVKKRVKAALNYRKPSVWICILTAIVCAAVAVCFLTIPKQVFSGSKIDLPISSSGVMDTPPSGVKDSVPNEPISAAILEANASSYPDEYDFECCDFVTLDTEILPAAHASENDAHTVIYYGWALYQRYNISENGIEDVGGSHIPVALSFEQNDNEYILKEYWEPRDGSYFVSDIRKKFPAHIADDGIDSQKYILYQIQSCYKQAVEFGGLNTDSIIEKLLTAICSQPNASSNPQDYIDKNDIDYRELLYYGEYTLRYCFRRFDRGDETGLEGKVMAIVCEELLQTKGTVPADAETSVTGQLWYDTFLAHAPDWAAPYR